MAEVSEKMKIEELHRLVLTSDAPCFPGRIEFTFAEGAPSNDGRVKTAGHSFA